MILVVSGATGGHLYPAIALCKGGGFPVMWSSHEIPSSRNFISRQYVVFSILFNKKNHGAVAINGSEDNRAIGSKKAQHYIAHGRRYLFAICHYCKALACPYHCL